MEIKRERWCIMRNNRKEIWCGLSKQFHFKPVGEIGETAIKTYRTAAQALAGCSYWNNDYEAVPCTETLEIHTDMKGIEKAERYYD